MKTEYEENETTEMWRDFKEASKEKRASNRESSTRQLRERGIAFEEKNDGAHLIVTAHGHIFDFWPGTGKYCERHGLYRRGLKNLLRDIECLESLESNQKGTTE